MRAKKLANPISNLISVPLQYNYDENYGSDEEGSVPINVGVAQMLKLGKQPIQLSVGARYWLDTPEGGPEDWGARLQCTFLFPK